MEFQATVVGETLSGRKGELSFALAQKTILYPSVSSYPTPSHHINLSCTSADEKQLYLTCISG